MLCIEYLVWDTRTEDFIDFLDNTPIEEMPEVLCSMAEFAIEYEDTKQFL